MMKKENLKAILMGTLAAAMMFGSTALAEELIPGVTVTENAESPTGYTATFVYENAEAEAVQLSGTFAYHKEGGKVGSVPEEAYTPFEYEAGMFQAGAEFPPMFLDMEKAEGTDYWTLEVPLPSGHYLYNYHVDGSEERLPDPANTPLTSTAETGHVSDVSTFTVPYAEVQGTSVNYDFLLPREDGQTGEVVFADYTDVNGDLAPLAIYLPYEYDAEREEAYRVLYLSHGGGGTETEWMACGSVPEIFDNLIAEGKVEDTIVVTMSNGVYEWDFEVIRQNVMENIIPFMEENYNVSTEVAERAFAGLSMGGMTTTYIYTQEADQFGYFGIFSGTNMSGFTDDIDVETLKLPTLMLGSGIYDGASTPSGGQKQIPYLTAKLADLEIPYDYYLVKGGHDWSVWPQLLNIFAEDYLWK